MEYPIIENNKRAEVRKQCSEIAKAEAAALEKHQPIPISISFLTNTCKEISYIHIETFCSEILGYFIPELRE